MHLKPGGSIAGPPELLSIGTSKRIGTHGAAGKRLTGEYRAKEQASVTSANRIGVVPIMLRASRDHVISGCQPYYRARCRSQRDIARRVNRGNQRNPIKASATFREGTAAYAFANAFSAPV